jgi:putative SOS response-associated peptidase YedK
MCARYTLTSSGPEITSLFGLTDDLDREFEPRFNIAPSEPISVIRMTNGKRELAQLRWGLIPYWANNLQAGGFVNARAETVHEKPAFRDPFRRRRCLVPADGFYEWQHLGKKKQPYYFRKFGGGVLAYAGVWDCWNSPDGPIETVALLTVPANDRVKPFHDRMPAILTEDHFSLWLDPREQQPDRLLPLLLPFPADRMESWPVSTRMNAVGTEELGLNAPVPEPLKPRSVQPNLFDVA